jgi:hypothetical protein
MQSSAAVAVIRKETVVRISTLLLIAVFAFVALPLAAQVNDTYVIPAAANSAGAFGTRWLTQFSVFNPQSYTLNVTLVFLPTGGQRGPDPLVLELPANSSAHSDDILGDAFEVGGTGALLVATFPEDNPGVPDDVLSRSFLVTSNTYNNSRNGTFGQTIPGIWTGLQDYDSDGISAVVHGIRNIATLGWRTNIGGVNLGDRSVVMRVTVFDSDGRRVLNDAPFTIPPFAHIQDRLPVEIDRGTIEFTVDDPSLDAVVFPYSSTIDALSGDPTYQTPVLLASPRAIYGKRAIVQEALGKKITIETARAARATLGASTRATLVKQTSGFRITK